MIALPIKQNGSWYAHKAIENGWSRNILVHQIDTRCTSGWARPKQLRTHLAQPQSELAQQLLATLTPSTSSAWVRRPTSDLNGVDRAPARLLLEPGIGFAFVGSQYHLEIGDQDFYRPALLSFPPALLCGH
ncbi:hypothetical protein [Candidatus Amarolinea dominans]|uniref:hypothetical protein n=1 Tax=Candidatus Amarolinea dominans TaxID=3140696 RepID=UPI0031CC67F2